MGVADGIEARSYRRGFMLTGFAICLLATTLTACSGEPRADAKAPAQPEAVPVAVGAVIVKAVPVQLSANGNVQPFASVTVKSQVDGQVAHLHFTEGQEVKQGDLLFTLDQAPFEATLRQAEATLARDAAQLQQAEAALGQSQAAADQADATLARDEAQLENANAQARRYKSLIDEGAVSNEQYDQIRTAAVAAEATIRADQAAINSSRAAIQAAQATVENVRAVMEADRAVVANARIQLGYTEIRAPMDGRTGNLLVHVGSAVKARDDSSQLVVINQTRPIYVSFALPEQALPDIRKYQSAGSLAVEAILPGQDQARIRGVLSFMNNTVDPATGTIQLKATFSNEDNRLWPGQFLNVALTLTTDPNALVVPSQAIQTGQQGAYVFVVKADRTVESRAVTPGRTLESETVVEKGLAPGEQVVLQGQLRLVPGTRVSVRSATPAASAEKAG
ncbi:MAG TPA: efflux RND transporter periplasmic adaptor subunit [Candidatus Sulfotelmatobacter sp.]|nr:efflux RND transporter periplasmic adaptor subunit [Candidatus Sulfotelmatobacter sp.]